MLLKRGVPLYTHFWPNCLTFGEVVEDVEDVKGGCHSISQLGLVKFCSILIFVDPFQPATQFSFSLLIVCPFCVLRSAVLLPWLLSYTQLFRSGYQQHVYSP